MCIKLLGRSPTPIIQVIQADIGSDSNRTNIVLFVFALMTHQVKRGVYNYIQFNQSPGYSGSLTKLELAVMHALSKLNVEIHYCSYRFCKALILEAKSLGINLNRHNNRIITLCGKLALLPESLINGGWVYIESDISPHESELNKFVKLSKILDV